MASTSICTMTLGGQNMQMMQNNCVLVSANHLLGGKNQQIFSHGKRPIAPAPTILTSNGANQSINIPKKKYNYGSMQYPSSQTASVARRNARERNRVKQVNNGFSNLRQHIPSTVVSSLNKGASASRGSAKKLSKVDTLKMAVEYIRSLKDMLDDNENSTSAGSTSSYYSESSQQLRSEASLSPTPSYSSDASSTMSYTPNHMQSHQTHFKQEPFDTYIDPSTSPAPSYHSDIPIHHQQVYVPTSTPYKPINVNHQYNNFSPASADDEDLLDAITWWQQQ